MTAHADTPLLVVSCDRYADLWKPFFTIFFRQWPDCPYPVYLGTNFARFDDPRVKMICIGNDVSWASGLASMLDALRSEHVILFLEDFLIQQPVDDGAVRRFVDAARSHHVASIRLSPLPPPSGLPEKAVPGREGLGVVAPGTPYRVSAQPAVWDTAALRRYLVPGFSAWQFEEIGTRLSEFNDDVFWGPFEPAVVYDHGVEKGRWKPAGLAICRALGVPVDLEARPVFTDRELAEYDEAAVTKEANAAERREMIAAFRVGHRAAGLRAASVLMLRRQGVVETAVIAVFGLLGRRAMRLLDRAQLARKVRRSSREFEQRSRRERTSAPEGSRI